MISHSASSIKANDKVQGVIGTSTIGSYSNGYLAFSNDRMARFLINVSRAFVRSRITIYINYFGQGTLYNYTTVTLSDRKNYPGFMNLIQVKTRVCSILRVTLIYHTLLMYW